MPHRPQKAGDLSAVVRSVIDYVQEDFPQWLAKRLLVEPLIFYDPLGVLIR
jgi:hypothetical protein